MTSINFAYNSGLGMKGEAACTLDITGPNGTVSLIDVLVDTGADYVMVPRVLANRLGINLRNARRINVRGVGGSVRMFLVAGVSVSINGNTGSIDVLFNPSSSSMPLVGRNGIDLLKAIAVDRSDWFWN